MAEPSGSVLDLFRLVGRAAVVTGSGRGIGRGIGLADAGADVVLHLASPASSWVTGQRLLVGGGREGGRAVEHRWPD